MKIVSQTGKTLPLMKCVLLQGLPGQKWSLIWFESRFLLWQWFKVPSGFLKLTEKLNELFYLKKIKTSLNLLHGFVWENVWQWYFEAKKFDSCPLKRTRGSQNCLH